MASAIERAIARHRRALADREQDAVDIIHTAHRTMLDALYDDLEALAAKVEAAAESGQTINPDWLRRQERYQRLIDDIQRAYASYEPQALAIVADAKRGVSIDARGDAIERADALGFRTQVMYARINTPALETLTGLFAPDSPLRGVMSSHGDKATAIITDELVRGMGRGSGADVIVRAIRNRLGGDSDASRVRALVRTEMLRSYRSSLFSQYASMGFPYWRWSAALQARTCLACLAMHGTVHSMDDPFMPAHPQCRCSPQPSMSAEVSGQTGEDWLKTQDDATLAAMMPNGEARQAFKDGALRLSDFVGTVHSDEWGTSIYQLSGKRALLERDAVAHPVNPRVRKDKNGVWGGDELPVMEWEVASERRIVPDDIVDIIGASSPVARVDVDTARKQPRKHRQTIDQWNDFDNVIRDWEWWRKQSPEEARDSAYERWQFVQTIVDDDTPGGWPLLTVLEKQPDGTIKVVTSHRRRDSFWNSIKDGDQYRQREKE